MTDTQVPVTGAAPVAGDAPIQRPRRRNVLALGGAQLTTWTITFLWTLVVPRRLGASGWGMIVTGSAVAGVFGIMVGAGTGNYLVREFIRRPEGAPRLLRTSLTLRLALLLPAAAILAGWLHLTHFGGTEHLIIWMAVAGIAFMLLTEPLDAVFTSVERQEFLAAGDVFNTAAGSFAAIGLVLLGMGVVPVALSSLIVTAVLFGLKWRWSRRFYRPARERTTVRQATTVARESVPYWTATLFVSFYVWIDSTMLSLMAPARVVGYYGVALRLFGTFQFAANMLARLWLPRLIASHEDGSVDFRRVARIPVEQVFLLALPVGLGGAAVSSQLVHLLFGHEFAGAAYPMAFLSLALIPLYVNIIAYSVLVAMGRQAVWTRIIVVASVVNPLLNLFMIRLFQHRYGNGATGAAVSLLVTEAMIAVLSLVIVTKGIVNRDSALRLVRSGVAAVAMAGAVWAARPLGLVPRVAIGVVVYGALALLLRVPSEEDLATLATLVRRVGRRRAPAAAVATPGPGTAGLPDDCPVEDEVHGVGDSDDPPSP
ncbi:MAG TPA: flippase [Acidimicrobiales bacterium]|nr:flippase [Acidimicrobiales bacterium]